MGQRDLAGDRSAGRRARGCGSRPPRRPRPRGRARGLPGWGRDPRRRGGRCRGSGPSRARPRSSGGWSRPGARTGPAGGSTRPRRSGGSSRRAAAGSPIRLQVRLDESSGAVEGHHQAAVADSAPGPLASTRKVNRPASGRWKTRRLGALGGVSDAIEARAASMVDVPRLDDPAPARGALPARRGGRAASCVPGREAGVLGGRQGRAGCRPHPAGGGLACHDRSASSFGVPASFRPRSASLGSARAARTRR